MLSVRSSAGHGFMLYILKLLLMTHLVQGTAFSLPRLLVLEQCCPMMILLVLSLTHLFLGLLHSQKSNLSDSFRYLVFSVPVVHSCMKLLSGQARQLIWWESARRLWFKLVAVCQRRLRNSPWRRRAGRGCCRRTLRRAAQLHLPGHLCQQLLATACLRSGDPPAATDCSGVAQVFHLHALPAHCAAHGVAGEPAVQCLFALCRQPQGLRHAGGRQALQRRHSDGRAGRAPGRGARRPAGRLSWSPRARTWRAGSSRHGSEGAGRRAEG
mmetsp:Transcript_13161/g.37579  ORF Transcript_13161/g.37579 Transcript_13161/m.37579 type:complete len:269 (-) Transcript_13161:100-906(-)